MKWLQHSLTVSLKSAHRWSPSSDRVCMWTIHHPALRCELPANVKTWTAQVMGTKVMPLTFFNSLEQCTFYLSYVHWLHLDLHFLVLAGLVSILFLCYFIFFFKHVRVLCINQLLIKSSVSVSNILPYNCRCVWMWVCCSLGWSHTTNIRFFGSVFSAPLSLSWFQLSWQRRSPCVFVSVGNAVIPSFKRMLFASRILLRHPLRRPHRNTANSV